MTTQNAQSSRDQYRHGDSNPGTVPSDLIRGYALSLRDLAEQCAATAASMTLENGTELVYDTDDGFTLLPIDSDPLDITEWVDRVDFVPVEGVTSVRQQPELRAGKA